MHIYRLKCEYVDRSPQKWVDSYKVAEIYRMPDVAVCCSVLQCVAVCCSVLQCVAVCCRSIGCQISWITFRKLANNYRALLRKMTCKDKASYESLLPCMYTAYCIWSVIHSFNLNLQSQSPWSLFNGTWLKRARELEHRLGCEQEDMTLQMPEAVPHVHASRQNDTPTALGYTNDTSTAIGCKKNTPNGIGCTNRSDFVTGIYVWRGILVDLVRHVWHFTWCGTSGVCDVVRQVYWCGSWRVCHTIGGVQYTSRTKVRQVYVMWYVRCRAHHRWCALHVTNQLFLKARTQYLSDQLSVSKYESRTMYTLEWATCLWLLGCNDGGAGGIVSKVKRLVAKWIGTRKRLFSGSLTARVWF